MPKVIQLIDSRSFGGIETHVLNLSIALKRRNIDSEVWYISDYGPHPLEEKLTQAGILFKKHMGLKDIWQKLKLADFDILHTHGYKAGFAGRAFATCLRIPVVSTYHSGDDGTGKVWIYNKLDQLTAFLGHSISVSHEIAEKLITQTRMISNFVDLPEFKQKNWRGNIAFVGRLSHEKGPDQFCYIVKDMDGINPIIFGDGPMRKELEYNFAQKIEFRGHVQNMSAHWDQIDLLCITSRNEGLPLVALEAMSHGIPVVSFDIGGLPQLIQNGKNGYLVTARDLRAFRQAIDMFSKLSDKRKHRMSHAAYKTIEASHSEDAILPKIQSVYDFALRKA